jgi:hypothetical protein
MKLHTGILTAEANKTIVGKPEGKIPLERPSLRCRNTFEVDLNETGCEGVN